MNLKRFKSKQEGQALVEFALILIVLLLLVFFIVEASRILWGWAMAQNAARVGARYAVTGQYEFNQDCFTDPTPCTTDVARVSSIEDLVFTSMDGVPISDDPDAGLEDDNFLLIEVYGVQCFDDACSAQDYVLDFAGEPGKNVLVRVVYNVPIITPILSGIVSNVRVVGQVIEQNELFGQLGGLTSGAALPPEPPPPPTAGPSPTFTPSPTPTSTASPTPSATPTDGPSPTPSETPTNTPSPTPEICPIRYLDPATDIVAGGTTVQVSGDFNSGNIPPSGGGTGHTITLIDATDGSTLVVTTIEYGIASNPTLPCDGFKQIVLPTGVSFVEGHVIVIQSDDGTSDSYIVQPNVDTPTPTNTPTPQPTSTATATPTLTPTPPQPFVIAVPDCEVGPNVTFTLSGGNWPTSTTLYLFWDGNLVQPISTSTGSFTQSWSFTGVANGFYTVRVEVASTGDFATTQVQVDDNCGFVTPPPNTPTNTPQPADLIIVGDPVPLVTPPIGEFTPVAFQVVISNTGEVQIDQQFFVDIYLDPDDEAIADLPEVIDINASSGYMAVSSLGPMSSRVLTITVNAGFTGGITTTREVYGMVDSLQQVPENAAGGEENNVSGPLLIDYVTPGISPTPSPTPDGASDVSGIVYLLLGSWVPQARADVYLVEVDESDGSTTVLQTEETDVNGFYEFNGVSPPLAGFHYDVIACFTVDSTDTFSGLRTNVVPPDPFVSIFMLADLAGCPATTP